MIKTISFFFLVLLFKINSQTSENKYFIISWNRTLLVPAEKLSYETSMLLKIFNSTSGVNYFGQYIYKSETNKWLSIADGSISYYSKQLFLFVKMSSGSTAKQQSVTKPSYFLSKLYFRLSQVDKQNALRESRKVESAWPSQLSYSLFNNQSSFKIRSSQISIEMEMQQVQTNAFFIDFIFAELINIIPIIFNFLFFLILIILGIIKIISEYQTISPVLQTFFLPFFMIITVYSRTQYEVFIFGVIKGVSLDEQKDNLITFISYSMAAALPAITVWYSLFPIFRSKQYIKSSLRIIMFLTFLYQFDFNTLLIFTAVNIYLLQFTKLKDQVKYIQYVRMGQVVIFMLMMHLLQYALFKNPGVCDKCFNQDSFTSTTISIPQILLIDFNGLISSQFLRNKMGIIVQRTTKYISTKLWKQEQRLMNQEDKSQVKRQ